jgi:hypothetical protein
MKTGLAKKLPLLAIFIVLMASTGTALADTTTRPYIKTFGSDVMSGGWFNGSSGCTSGPGSNYQNSSFSSSSFAADTRYGGILTYTKSGGGIAQGGSSSQYGAFSLGEIDGRAPLPPTPPNITGFYSQGSQPNSNVNKLSFANTDATLPFGGEFEGSNSQGNCIPDYFDKLDPTAATTPIKGNLRGDFNSPSTITYYGNAPAGNLDLFGGSGAPAMNLRAGNKIAIFVKGNVYISRNVIYDSASTVDKVPKFMLVVRGSIYVDPGVTRLDGLYIAQPIDNTPGSVGSDTGVFWTCHDQASSPAPDPYYPPANCTQPLVVNGAVVAKQVNFLRVGGSSGSTTSDVVTTANTGEDNPGTVTNCSNSPSFANCHVSEVFNYIPAMFMGGSFFDTSSSSTSGGLHIDSEVSLPPVF